jgi:hypothetical protein
MRPLLLLAAASMGACTRYNCQSTCRHVYEPSECGILQGGRTPEESIDDCVATCEAALTQPGTLCTPDPESGKEECYDPMIRYPTNNRPSLETDQQAAAWIDCVWTLAPEAQSDAGCDELDPRIGGLCAPI